MLLASKHFSIVIGIDIHFTTVPPWNPIHPYIGFVFDVGDYIPFLGSDTYVNNILRGASDTSGYLSFRTHIPIATGPFAMMPIIGHESTNFFGSLNTYCEGCRFTPAPYMEMTCNDIGIPLSLHPGKKFKPIPTLFAPTSVSIPIPIGAPVNVGGPYVPDWTAMIRNMIMGFGIGCLFKGLGKALGKGLKALNSLLKKSPNSKWASNLSDFLCKKGFEPVNLVTGAVEYEGVDFELSGPFPLVWKRKWMSDSLWQGLLGHGCHSNFDMRIERFDEYKALVVTLADGRPATFEDIEEGGRYFNREEKLTLTRSKYTYELFDHNDRKTYSFAIKPDRKEYFLSTIKNEAGHEIKLRYTSHGHLYQIIDSAGRILRVHNDDKKRVTKVSLYKNELWNETLVEYRYNEDGDMSEIIDALGKSTNIVYQNHLMVKKTDRNGQSFYWEYDGVQSKSRCIHTWGDNGILEGRISYHNGYNLVTDSLGNVTRYDFMPDGRVTSVTNPLGDVEITEYTPEGDIMREIDPMGNITAYDYNDEGQITTIHYPDGSKLLYSYDKEGRLASRRTPEGATTIYLYNEQGLLRTVISPDNQTTSYKYNEDNLIAEVQTSTDRKISLVYDDKYNLKEATLPDGLKSEWEYDYRGRLIKTSNATGGQSKYDYDVLGRMIKSITPDGNVVNLTYNAYDEVVRAQDKERTVDFAYTPLGSLKARRENGKILRFNYNTEEQLVNLKNENGEEYSFGRDKAGRIIRESGFDGLTRTYTRLPNGLVRRVNRPDKRYSEYIYDSKGLLCGVEYHDGTFEQFSYNKDGQLIEAHNQNSVVRFTRDKVGRIVEEWQDDYLVQSHYSKQGQRIKVTSSLGADLSMNYTEAGFLASMQGKQSDQSWGMQLSYNERGLEVERALTGGVVSRNEYNSIGQVHRHTVTSGNRRTRQMRYSWNQNDRLMSIIDELNNQNTWFDYDTMGNLTGASYNDTEKLFRVPDAIGNLYKTANRSDRTYDKGGKLLQADKVRYHYDDEGNLVEKASSKGERWEYTWNANGSLHTVQRPDRGLVSFEYDALGRRTAKVYKDKITRWVWDGNTPLHEWKYSLSDRPKVVSNIAGIKSKDREEPIENLITWVFEEGSFRPTAKLTDKKSYSIITDYLGTPSQMYDESGKLTWQGELDIYGKLRNFEGSSPTACPFRYQGQYEDQETGLYYNRFRYYSPDEGMYISQDPIRVDGGLNLYSYVDDSNSWVDVLGLVRGPKDGAYKDLPHIDNHTKHHIIPDALRDHPLLKEINYDINNVDNIIYLPHTSEVDPSRTVHPKHGGHLSSHKDMGLAELDRIHAMDASPEIKRMHVDAYTNDMRSKYLANDPNVKLTNKCL